MKGLDVLKLMLLFFYFYNSIAGDGDLCWRAN